MVDEPQPVPGPAPWRSPVWLGWLVFLAGLLFAHLVVITTRDVDAWGWDESTHVELPAARIVAAEGLRGRLEVVNTCNQYPPAAPVYQAFVQGLFGVGESVARRAALALWLLAGLGGLCALGRRLERTFGAGGELGLVLPALACLSPIVWRFAPSLFLEVPFLVAATWALWAWLGRQGTAEEWRRGRELAAGALVTLAFFTKFNYGLLLGAGLALDWVFETLAETRRRRLGKQLSRSVWLVGPPLAGFLWWFVYPWPGGVTQGELHWRSLLGFLGGNRELGVTPLADRLVDWTGGAFPHVIWFVLAGAAVVFVLGWRTVDRTGRLVAPSRCLLLVALALIVPPALHPFHLDRFLIPGLLPLWCLTAIAAGALAARPRALAGTLIVAGLTTIVVPRHLFAGWIGLLHNDPEVRAYQEQVLDRDHALFGKVPTAGLDRATYDALTKLIIREVGPEERVAWIGMSSEYSRAALHLELWRAGGSIERFRTDAHRQMDVVPVPGAPLPELDDALRDRQLAAFAEGYDVILITTPPDLKDRSRPGFYAAWQAPLVQRHGWTPNELGRLAVPRPGRPELEVLVFALRRAKGEGDG